MDLHMPGIDGTEAIRRIRALPDPVKANVPIVVLSADVTDASQRAARAAGADAVVGKPFQMALLKRVIVDLLDQRSSGTKTVPSPCPPSEPESPDSAAGDTCPIRCSPDPSLVPPGSLVVRQWDELGPSAVTELVTLFRDTTPPRLEALEAALKADDAEAVAEEAHALKGAAGVLGLSPLHALLSEMEADARCGDVDAVREVLPRARTVLLRTLEALEHFISPSTAAQ